MPYHAVNIALHAANAALADALAATGHFDEADHVARETLQPAEHVNQTNLAAQLKARLQSYADR